MILASKTTVYEVIDLENRFAGGIDTAIFDVLEFSQKEFKVVGVTNDKKNEGVVKNIYLGDKKIEFLPIATLSRTKKRVIPHSLKYSLALFKYRKTVKTFKSDRSQVHRLEVGFCVYLLIDRNHITQCIHNDFKMYKLKTAESYWRYVRFAYFLLERAVIPKFGQVIVFSRMAAQRLKNYSDSVSYLSTWYNPSVFYYEDNENTQPLTILFVGRLEAQKNPLLFFEIAQELAKLTERKMKIIVAGDGSLKDTCSAYANSKNLDEFTAFLGFIEPNQLANVMRNSSVLVMTSNFEGSPRVLYEAGGCGLPVVSTIGSDPDNWLDGQNGISIDSHSHVELARAVVKASQFSRAYCSEKAKSKSAQVLIQQYF
jgi:glycosyltransferase involved in cell wall biosynthesis